MPMTNWIRVAQRLIYVMLLGFANLACTSSDPAIADLVYDSPIADAIGIPIDPFLGYTVSGEAADVFYREDQRQMQLLGAVALIGPDDIVTGPPTQMAVFTKGAS